MARNQFVLIVLLLLLNSLAKAQNTVLTGNVKGLPTTKVNITYNLNGVRTTDTVEVVKDVFTWKANLSEPQLILMDVNNHSNFFFAEPGFISLTRGEDVGTYKITGSPTQEDAERFAASIGGLTKQIAILRAKKPSGQIKARLDSLYEERERSTIQFIADHPRSFYSLHLVAGRASFNSDYDEIQSLFNKLDTSIRNTESGQALVRKLETIRKSGTGMRMANFTQADTSGNPVNFSSFRGKYVLVDFWASWCAPCRAENPNVLKAYNSFKDKGFTVLGISLDHNAANWKKAIQEDKMPWTQLSDLKGWKNEVSTLYGVQGIPANLLIDPDGIIVAKNLRGEALHRKLKEMFD